MNVNDIRGVDETTALGVVALWNDAVPFVRHMLDHQIDDITDGIRQALECDSEDCQTHDVRHFDDSDQDELCPCWGCANSLLLTTAEDLRTWLDDIDAGGPAYGGPSAPDRLLGLVDDFLYVNEQAPYTKVPIFRMGSVYRLMAELADQTNAYYETFKEATRG
ncbi:hypothetical protein [Actinacidiphila glaucinigra]|uniref:hypothetical protein n=1 Tax=Actinacidiphila glaucinigra TaxID=235986 RepID=UPI00371D1ED3